MKKLLFGLLPLLLAGCVNSTSITKEDTMIADNNNAAMTQFKAVRDQWIGKDINLRIKEKGMPQAINKGRLGNFYTWKTYQATGQDANDQNTFVETICVETFKTDDRGVITEWVTKECYY